MKQNSKNKYAHYKKVLYNTVIALVFIAITTTIIMAYIDFFYTNNTVSPSPKIHNLLTSPLEVFKYNADKVLHPIYIQANSWRLLNQHVYILDTDNIPIFDNLAKIELGLAGPHTISIYFSNTGKYLCHKNTVTYCTVNQLTNHKLLISASWVPYVSLNKNGLRCYSFATGLNIQNNSLNNIWLTSDMTLTNNDNSRGMFILKDANTNNIIPPTMTKIYINSNMEKDEANMNMANTQIAPCDAKCRSQLDMEQYKQKQAQYMNSYFSYYDKANTIDNFKNTNPNTNTNTNTNTIVNVEGFSIRNNNKLKRNIMALKSNGMLDDLIVKDHELFQDVTDNTNNINNTEIGSSVDTDGNVNPDKADVFKPHTGLQFNNIMNHHIGLMENDNPEDKIFDKLEKAKMDPSVQNLLDYNQERYKIYASENNDLDTQLHKNVRQNTEESNNLNRRMDQYRIQNMARRLFFLQNNLN